MSRDKLITIRIEGEKREAFNQLAKSQNTDTASLLYDFINQCLSGQLDIKLVTGKGDRLDNRIDTNRIDSRIDKLETTTQKIDERLGIITKKLNDWILAFDDRLTDSDRGLSGKITSLEHRLNALSIQLDSQQDSQEMTTQKIDTDSQRIDRIDTDSQWIDDMEYLLKREKESSIADPSLPLPTSPDKLGDGGNGDTPDLPPSPPDRPALDAIETVTDKPDSIELVTGEGMNAAQAYRYLAQKGVKVSEKTLSNWVNSKKIPMTDKGDKVSEYLILRDGRYFPKTDQG